MAAKRAASPISTTGRTGCTTWPDENAASVVSIAAINSGIGRTVRISPSLRHSVTGGTAQSSKRQIGRLTTCAVRPKWGCGPQCHLVFATSYSLADFMFGTPNQINLGSYTVINLRQYVHSLYFQDDYR